MEREGCHLAEKRFGFVKLETLVKAYASVKVSKTHLEI